MDTRKSIKALPAKLWRILTKPPFAEVLLLVAVLIGMQQGYAILSQDKQQVVDTIASTTVDVETSSPSFTLDVNQIVDAINNPDALVHSIDAANAANTVLVLASAKTEQPNAYQFSDTQTPPFAEFEFASRLKQTLFSAVTGLPFTRNALKVRDNEKSELGFWHTQQPFTVAAKATAPIKSQVVAKAKPTSKRKPVTAETIAKAKAAARARAVAREKFVIMLDPGHGGTDPGSVGHNGLKEKVLTLDIAKRAERILEKQENIRVLLTRNGDTGMSRASRVERVKNSYADVVVSLHLNHLPQADVNVVETFYAGPQNIQESIQKQREKLVPTAATRRHDYSFTRGSKKLALLVQKNVYEEVIEANPDTNNAGVKQDTLYILTRSFTPGVLIELTCLSNIQEAERLAHADYRESLAQALANGVIEYLNSAEGKKLLGSEV